MKKPIVYGFYLLACLSLVGCTNDYSHNTQETIYIEPSLSAAPQLASYASNPDINIKTASATTFDEYGWKARIELSLNEGVVSSIDFDYFNLDENRITADEYLNSQTLDSAGLTLSDIINSLEQQVTETQDISLISTISGAENITAEFTALFNDALKK